MSHDLADVRTFVIVASNPIIRLDLVGIVKMAFSQCVVHDCDRFDEAQGHLGSTTVHTCVLLDGNLCSPDVAARLSEIAASGAQVVVIGDAPVAIQTEFDLRVLRVPFTNDSVLDALDIAPAPTTPA